MTPNLSSVLYIMCFALLIGLYACSGTFYTGTSRMQRNNTVTIRCTEPNFKVTYKDRKTTTELEVVPQSNGLYTVVTPSPRPNPRLKISKPNYEEIPHYLNRSMLTRALVFDIIMAVPAVGLSLIIDPFKPTFYALSGRTKDFQVEMRCTRSYMNAEFIKIEYSDKPDDIEVYMDRFLYSDQYRLVLDARDSVVVNTAILNRDEKAFLTYNYQLN